MAALFEQAAQGGHDLGLAAQRHTPLVNRITRLFSLPYWRARFAGAAAEPTAAAAREALENAVTQAAAGQNIPADEVRAVMGRLPRALSNVLNAAGSRIRGGAEGTIGRMPGGWRGALIGAALVTAPFAIYRFLKTRSLRQRGGTAAQSAAEKAERLLSEAGQLRSSRKKLLSSPKQEKKQEKGAA